MGVGAKRENTRGVSSGMGRRMRPSGCGREMNTLWGRRGGRIGRLVGPGGSGAGVTVMWSSMVTVVVRCEERHSGVG